MTLDELLDVVDTLSLDEMRQLRERIEQREREATSVDELDRVLAAMREGLTDDDLDQLEWAMNARAIYGPLPE